MNKTEFNAKIKELLANGPLRLCDIVKALEVPKTSARTELLKNPEIHFDGKLYSLVAPEKVATIPEVVEEVAPSEAQAIAASELSIFNYKSIAGVRTVSSDGEIWYCLNDICEILLLANPRSANVRVPSSQKKRIKIQTIGGIQSLNFITEEGVKRVVSSSTKPQAKKLAIDLGIEVLCTTKEQDILFVLQNAFKHLTPIHEFYVGGYRLDLYFVDHKIAIECDENDHSHYDQKLEKQRQEFITRVLGCHWVRFNPSHESFCIGNVINKIITIINAQEKSSAIACEVLVA